MNVEVVDLYCWYSELFSKCLSSNGTPDPNRSNKVKISGDMIPQGLAGRVISVAVDVVIAYAILFPNPREWVSEAETLTSPTDTDAST